MARSSTSTPARSAARASRRSGSGRPVAPANRRTNDACFIVKDRNGFALSYVYYEDEPGRRTASNLMTRDETRRVANNIAKLPDVLRITRQ